MQGVNKQHYLEKLAIYTIIGIWPNYEHFFDDGATFITPTVHCAGLDNTVHGLLGATIPLIKEMLTVPYLEG
jgi:hypothetical protein